MSPIFQISDSFKFGTGEPMSFIPHKYLYLNNYKWMLIFVLKKILQSEREFQKFNWRPSYKVLRFLHNCTFREIQGEGNAGCRWFNFFLRSYRVSKIAKLDFFPCCSSDFEPQIYAKTWHESNFCSKVIRVWNKTFCDPFILKIIHY